VSGDRRRSDRRRMPPVQWGQMNYMIAGTDNGSNGNGNGSGPDNDVMA